MRDRCSTGKLDIRSSCRTKEKKNIAYNYLFDLDFPSKHLPSEHQFCRKNWLCKNKKREFLKRKGVTNTNYIIMNHSFFHLQNIFQI